MSYDFQSCFWDPNDEGVNILLEHINNGIKSNANIENFFKLKFELQKDLSRRMGAINDKLEKDLSSNSDYGKLNDSLQKLLSIEKNTAKAHSKQSEIILQTIYNDVKSYNSQMRARYTTMSGKIENLRLDKFNKKKGCSDLSNRLEDAQSKVRDLTLNANNIIGQRKSEQNSKELAKWENNSNEISMQLNILKKEYKAAQKFWLREWAELSYQFQEMENSRIAFVQSKLQKYSECVMETSILEQTKLNLFTNELSMFTPLDDIAKFSSDYGTGRLKGKHQQRILTNNINSFNNINKTESSTDNKNTRNNCFHNNIYHENGKGENDKRNSYMESIRKLSNQLQQTYLNKNDTRNPNSPDTDIAGTQTRKMCNLSNKSYRYSLHESNLPSYNDRNAIETVAHESMLENDNEEMTDYSAYTHGGIANIQIKNNIHSRKSSEESIHNYSNKEDNAKKASNNAHIEKNVSTLDKLQVSHRKLNSKTDSEFSGTSSSSNPTDFTTHRRRSVESFSTSVTSMATSIDDNQRFAKSWNSTNRKRKSMSHISDLLDTSIQSQVKQDDNKRSGLRLDSRESNSDTRQVSTNTILVKSLNSSTNDDYTRFNGSNTGRSRTRRRSMVLETSNNPIADALYEMEKLQGGVSNDIKLGRVRDNGIVVTLPLVTRTGKDVIKYAKAVYPLLEDTSDEVVQFDKNDYLLITEEVNQDWYMGEVYDNERIDVNHRYGLIPFNFIEFLE